MSSVFESRLREAVREKTELTMKRCAHLGRLKWALESLEQMFNAMRADPVIDELVFNVTILGDVHRQVRLKLADAVVGEISVRVAAEFVALKTDSQYDEEMLIEYVNQLTKEEPEEVMPAHPFDDGPVGCRG